MIDDKKLDLWQHWYENGQLNKREFFIEAGIKHGWYYTWTDEGILTTEGYYDQGKKQGPWQSHFNNGQISKQEYYESGRDTWNTINLL